tara:strand:- start:170 stop:376 length:207 start_codon:yes stop_codon:yes gene_type:complete
MRKFAQILIVCIMVVKINRENTMNLTQEMIDIVDELCGTETSLEVEEKLIKLATLMQDEQNKMGIRNA